jgi:rRNA maturation endonuclease Nob1
MGILITCDNKGCYDSMEPLLNINTNEVICSSCGKPIQSVTQFMKIQLKSLGQTTKTQKSNQAYAVKCSSCGLVAQPAVTPQGAITCSRCGSQIENLPPPVAQMLRLMLGKGK